MLKKAIALIIFGLIILMYLGSNVQNQLTQPAQPKSYPARSGDVTAKIEDVSVLIIDRGDNQTTISFEIKVYVDNTDDQDFELDLFEADLRVTFPNKTITEVISKGGSDEGSPNASEPVGMGIRGEFGFISVTPLGDERKISRSIDIALQANSSTRFSIIEYILFEDTLEPGEMGELKVSGRVAGKFIFPSARIDSQVFRFTIQE